MSRIHSTKKVKTSGKKKKLNRKKLATRWIGLAHKLAFRFLKDQKNNRYDRDEFIAEALLGLTYASRKWDPKKKVPFPAYATKVIWHRLVNIAKYYHVEKRKAGVMFIGVMEGFDPADPKTPQSSPYPELFPLLKQILPAADYRLLKWVFVDELSFNEVAKKDNKGKTRQSYQLRFKRIKRKLVGLLSQDFNPNDHASIPIAAKIPEAQKAKAEIRSRRDRSSWQNWRG